MVVEISFVAEDYGLPCAAVGGCSGWVVGATAIGFCEVGVSGAGDFAGLWVDYGYVDGVVKTAGPVAGRVDLVCCCMRKSEHVNRV